MKDFLKNLIKKYNERMAQIRSAVQASNDVEEVRKLTAEAETVQAELFDTQNKLNELEANEQRSAQAVPENAQLVNGGVVAAAYNMPTEQVRNANPLDSVEYRSAFMAYVQHGTPIPAEFRSGDTISTEDTGAAIPITIMRDVINTVRKVYGNLYSKVRKMNVQGGVEFPIGELEASFHWIGEDTASPNQDLDKLGTVSFKYHTAEIRIAQSFLSSIVTMDVFEQKIVEVIAKAYMKAMDYGIVKGSGKGSMLGILNDSRVTSQVGHTISMTAAKLSNWKNWREDFFAKLPLGYRDGEFIFPVATVDKYLETMSDSNNQPVFRQATGLEVNDGDSRNPNGRFFGRDISLVEPDILPDFDSANANDVIGIYWQPNEYAINENFGFTMMRYFDQNNNKWINKALTVVDGKVLNPCGFYLITKASS